MNPIIYDKIFLFLKDISKRCGIELNDYVDIDSIDLDNPFESISDMIADNDGYNVEIIYYSNAIQYLQENDPSLTESLGLADELGYSLKNLNSEILASLLASENVRSNFYDLKNEIEEFFDDIKDSIDEDDTDYKENI